jgi:hypothetical protein
MDILELNMILKTTQTLINYGEIDESKHTLTGTVTSSSPFTFVILGDGIPLIPIQFSSPMVVNPTPIAHRLDLNKFFTTGVVKFELKMEGTDFDIQLKLWKPYPVSPVLPENTTV